MSQRVNIQYSVELSELQSEVERLLQKASGNLEIAELEKTLKSPTLLSLKTIEKSFLKEAWFTPFYFMPAILSLL